MVQGRENPAMICRCQKVGIGEKSADHRRIYNPCDVPIIQRDLDFDIRLYGLNIIFGLPGEEDIFWIINFCILYGKNLTFDCRINENIVSANRFKSKLKNRLEVEIYITCSCGIRLNTEKILLIEANSLT